MKIVITGANGHLGQRLISAVGTEHEVVAVVRSPRAAATLADARCTVHVVDYHDSTALAEVAAGAEVIVNLVGIIKESAGNRYEDAHERTCEVLSEVAASVGATRLLMVGIVGSDVASHNACLRSRARAEQALAAGTVPAAILRVPMVLGEGDYASAALLRRATSRVALTFRSASLEQPIYAGDVVAAVRELMTSGGNETLNLGGPEVVSRAALIQRAAALMGASPTVLSLPLVAGLLMTRLLESLMASPPMTTAMLELLDHDDAVDNSAALARLGIQLTGLDAMLSAIAKNNRSGYGT